MKLGFACLFLLACGTTMPVADDPAPDAPPATPDAPRPPDASTCTIPADATIDGTLAITADDRRRVWINGTLVADAESGWFEPTTHTVSLLRRGKNVLAIEGTNLQKIDGNDRGVLADLRVALPDGTIVTDAAFKVTTTATAGWEQPAFDDTAWSAPFVIGGATSPPWNDVFATAAPSSTASWLWSYDPNIAAANKPVEETLYARRTFAFIAEGCDSL